MSESGKETMDDVLVRHRRERKELQAKIQELKKNAPKSDKKKRKEAMEVILQLEHELEHRQAEELKTTHAKLDTAEQPKPEQSSVTIATNTADADVDASNDNEGDDAPNNQRVSKAQKRRDKKAREARQLEEEIRAAAADAHNTPKAIEARKIHDKLKELNLSEHPILSDGNCLYNAVRHQLELHGVGAYNVQALRNRTADYMRDNKDSFACYLSETDKFDKYCEDIRNTTVWGGQLELKALSNVYAAPIEVLQAEGPATLLGEQEKGPKLVITYHRHMYSLGEHYNSTQPFVANANDDSDNNI